MNQPRNRIRQGFPGFVSTQRFRDARQLLDGTSQITRRYMR
jgi:hypothetical protein